LHEVYGSKAMPAVGFGTYKFKGSGVAQRACAEAIKAGYRLIDTAFVYGGEKTEIEVGKAVRSSSVPRDEIFVITKHWRKYHGYEQTINCLDTSLKRLGLDYVDLYLMHWPGPAYTVMGKSKAVMEASPLGPFVYAHKGHERENIKNLRAETWRAMEDSLKAGKCKAIGVSNMTVAHLEALKETAKIWPPAVNQIELHPYHQQRALQEYCRKEGIAIQAYASLGGQDAGKDALSKLGGTLMERAEVTQVAAKHQRTPAEVLLRWSTQQGMTVIPKSSSAARMRENYAGSSGSNDFTLSEDEMHSITAIEPPAGSEAAGASRLCWKTDPLKHLNFE